MKKSLDRLRLAALLTSVMALGGSPTAKAVEYDLVLDTYGEPIGLSYDVSGWILRGELGILRKWPILLFVECESDMVLYGEQYMFRRSTNCANEVVGWPENLLADLVGASAVGKVKPARTKKVVLTTPKKDCGPCMPDRGQEFDLPEGVEIVDAELLKSIAPEIFREGGAIGLDGTEDNVDKAYRESFGGNRERKSSSELTVPWIQHREEPPEYPRMWKLPGTEPRWNPGDNLPTLPHGGSGSSGSTIPGGSWGGEG